MPYVNLNIHSGDDHVDSLIRRVIEPYLVEVHYLLAATRPSYVQMGILETPAPLCSSRRSNYQRDSKIRKNDKKHFTACLEDYLPWEHVKVEDGEHRPQNILIKQTSEILYTEFRCPLFHSGGLVGESHPGVSIVKIHPGHTELERAEQRVEELARCSTLNGHVFFKIEYKRNILYVDFFYCCVRKMVERFAADPGNAKLIREHSKRAK